MTSDSSFVAMAERYLAERRALGFGMKVTGARLLAFARFTDSKSQNRPLTLDMALAWARAASRPSPLTWGRRLEIVRPFAVWLRQHDARTVVPPGRYFGRVHRRLTPHVYTEAEVAALLCEAERLLPPRGLRSKAIATVLGLLACTGMRVSEALALRDADIDLKHGVLLVRLTKFRKSRLVPLHPSAVAQLKRFIATRDRAVRKRASSALFVIDGGVELTYSKLRTAFRRLRIGLGWETAACRRPRIHDLRHTFASRRLLLWHKERIDVDRRILDLSTYLGHAKASDTYWYLSAFPELMAIAARRFEGFALRQERP